MILAAGRDLKVNKTEQDPASMAVPSFFSRRPAWPQGVGAVTTRWLESTLEVARWENMRKAGKRWGKGAALGALVGVVLFAPASWLARGVVELTDGRLLLAESQGTVWQGDAVAILTGGPGSRDARALPGPGVAHQTQGGLGCACLCSRLLSAHAGGAGHQAGLGRVRAEVKLNPGAPDADLVAMGWSGIGLRPGSGAGYALEYLAIGRPVAHEYAGSRGGVGAGSLAEIEGQADLSLDNVSSPISTLDRLGSYRLDLLGMPKASCN